MKKVFNNSSVTVAFVKQGQSEGRNSNGSMYFVDNVLYSYGSHFPMCKIVGDTAIVTNRRYSSTTGKHMSSLHSALRGTTLRVIEVENPLAARINEVTANVKELIDAIEDTKLKASRSRKYKDCLNESVNRQSVNLTNYQVFISNIIANAA